LYQQKAKATAFHWAATRRIATGERRIQTRRGSVGTNIANNRQRPQFMFALHS